MSQRHTGTKVRMQLSTLQVHILGTRRNGAIRSLGTAGNRARTETCQAGAERIWINQQTLPRWNGVPRVSLQQQASSKAATLLEIKPCSTLHFLCLQHIATSRASSQHRSRMDSGSVQQQQLNLHVVLPPAIPPHLPTSKQASGSPRIRLKALKYSLLIQSRQASFKTGPKNFSEPSQQLPQKPTTRNQNLPCLRQTASLQNIPVPAKNIRDNKLQKLQLRVAEEPQIEPLVSPAAARA